MASNLTISVGLTKSSDQIPPLQGGEVGGRLTRGSHRVAWAPRRQPRALLLSPSGAAITEPFSPVNGRAVHGIAEPWPPKDPARPGRDNAGTQFGTVDLDHLDSQFLLGILEGETVFQLSHRPVGGDLQRGA